MRNKLNTGEHVFCLEEIDTQKIASITFTGGEPSLNSDIYNILEYYRKNDIHIGYITNGTIPLDDLIYLIDSIYISIDGDYNVMKKQRSLKNLEQYKQILKLIELIIKSEKKATVSMTITNYNLHTFSNYIKKLVSLFGMENLIFSITPVYRYTRNNHLKNVIILKYIDQLRAFYSYKINIDCDIISKENFLDIYTVESPVFFPVFYDIYLKSYSLNFNNLFSSYTQLENEYFQFNQLYFNNISDFLKIKNADYLFNPFDIVLDL